MDEMDQNIVKIKVPNTKFWVLGEKMTSNTWKMFLIDPQSNYKEIIKESISTKTFVMLSNVVLKTSFPSN